MNIVWNIVLQVIYFIVSIYFMGFVISLLNRLFYKLLWQKMVVIYATGFIGTPIHELSHAAMCVLFFHKIDEIKLFQIDTESGVLGYVKHSYNKKNLYQQLGNYFIGVAPVMLGSVILFFAIKWLLPATSASIDRLIGGLASIQGKGQSLQIFEYLPSVSFEMIKTIFTNIPAVGLWLVFLVICMCIALHMNLSGADIKGSLVALPLLILLIAIVNAVLGLAFPTAYAPFCVFMNRAGIYLIGMMILAMIVSLFCVAVGLLIRGVVMLGRIIIKRKIKI